ncbi:MAG: glycosyltransferase [Sandaracinaceae bacterium]|nr:glycosyltransferase [Sandaracinaceae bacterium]
MLFFHGTLHYWPNTEAVRFIAEELLPRLLPRHPELRVLIAGLSPPLYYAHSNIVFSGPVEDRAWHIAAADLCLCPIRAGGGTRLKLLEYMAAGRPTVSTAKGAEGIRYGDALCIADEAETFAAAVLRLLGDKAEADALGLRGARFAARYDWSRIGRAYLDLYEGRERGSDHNDHILDGPAPAVALTSIEAHLPPRKPSKPLTMLLLINRGCNLRCSFCDLWDGHVHMPLERLLPLLDDAVAIGTRTLVITGGEPFLHPDLFRAVAEARARGLAVNITTNGTRTDARWDELVASGVSSLSFSVDGEEATHDRLRGQPGAWRKTWKSIERVLAHGGIGVSVYTTVNRDNVGELPGLYDRVRALGAGFDFWPVNDAPDLAMTRPEDHIAWHRALAHIAARDPAVAARRAYYEEGTAYHAGHHTPVRCLGFVDQYGVTYDGRLLPCCVWGGDGLAMGNVFERPLRELWHSAEVQGFRERLFADGCEVGCFNHSLYEFSASTGLPFRVERPAPVG